MSELRGVAMIELTAAKHRYEGGGTELIDLPDLNVGRGEEWLVLGPSGSGKSTLLHVMAAVLEPSEGEYRLDGRQVWSLSPAERDRLRGRMIGVVFQRHHLIDVLTVRENVDLARHLAGFRPDPSKVDRLLDRLDLGEKANTPVPELSEGQKQRVAIARAVVNDPLVLLADEPTASLDDERAESVLNLLQNLAADFGCALLLTTHDQRVKARFPRIVRLPVDAGSAGEANKAGKSGEAWT